VSGRLAGKNVVVVGAGMQPCDDDDAPVGNGRAISVLAGREGASVVCVDIDRAAAEETAAAVEAEGATAHVVVADVAQAADCARLVAESREVLGSIHGLALNVGISLGDGMLHTTIEQWDMSFAVNVRAHFLIAQAALPVLEDGSAIVFSNTTSALLAFSSRPAYDASKAALRGLCRHMAMEAGPRVRANEIGIGSIDTPLSRAYRRELAAGTSGISPASWLIPLDRRGSAWEIAAAAVFLLSDEASYITGQILTVDGGFTAAK
jgi:NAD(P)-dependent dehydrogenase (short-subunit alcohol dehydrogenase family)